MPASFKAASTSARSIPLPIEQIVHVRVVAAGVRNDRPPEPTGRLQVLERAVICPPETEADRRQLLR